MGKITQPEAINSKHYLNDFDCGEPVLNEWLKRYALRNEVSGASRTFVVCSNIQVVGFYALATGSVRREESHAKIKRNMPEPIPVMILGRLAVDLRWQNQGLGKGLLKDAFYRTLYVSKQAGIKAMVVHALSHEAKCFYMRHGFWESPLNPMTLMLGLSDFQKKL